MHELGLCEGILDAALRRADGRRVRAVRVRVGGHPVDPDVIDQGFRLAALGTIAEDARVDLVQEPSQARCRDCGATAPAEGLALASCRVCGGVDIEVLGGETAVLESITFDRPD
jgi:hydrogenase nickel incorporation protein HypA/HybF